MYKLLFVFLLFLSTPVTAQIDTAGTINKKIINAVVQVHGNLSGTGFLISRGQQIFLVTNKHIIGSWTPVDSLIPVDNIHVSFYSNKGLYQPTINIGKRAKLNDAKVKVHPNPLIDIAVIDITKDIENKDVGKTIFLDTGFLMKLEEASKLLTYGSTAFTIGYPNGIKSYTTNEPLVKTCHLASSLDGTMKVMQNWTNRLNETVSITSSGKIFILDGLIIPGNSGGPVVMSQEVVWISVNGTPKYLKNPENVILGIISNIFTNAGLAVVFSSDHIREVIDLF